MWRHGVFYSNFGVGGRGMEPTTSGLLAPSRRRGGNFFCLANQSSTAGATSSVGRPGKGRTTQADEERRPEQKTPAEKESGVVVIVVVRAAGGTAVIVFWWAFPA